MQRRYGFENSYLEVCNALWQPEDIIIIINFSYYIYIYIVKTDPWLRHTVLLEGSTHDLYTWLNHTHKYMIYLYTYMNYTHLYKLYTYTHAYAWIIYPWIIHTYVTYELYTFELYAYWIDTNYIYELYICIPIWFSPFWEHLGRVSNFRYQI